MDTDIVIERLFCALITGDRRTARLIMQELSDASMPSWTIVTTVLWPLLELMTTLRRAGQIGVLAENYATRLLRSLIGRIEFRPAARPAARRAILIFCEPVEAAEISMEIVSARIEAAGHHVAVGGGGVADDEILAEIGRRRPTALLLIATSRAGTDRLLRLTGYLRSIDPSSATRIVVVGPRSSEARMSGHDRHVCRLDDRILSLLDVASGTGLEPLDGGSGTAIAHR